MHKKETLTGKRNDKADAARSNSPDPIEGAASSRISKESTKNRTVVKTWTTN